MTLQEQLEIVQAAIDGKQVESRVLGGPWLLVLAPATPVNYHFDFQRSEYRVKPQPREWWAEVYKQTYKQSGLQGGLWETKEQAVNSCNFHDGREVVHVREVLDE